ncbi:hypothetical protein O3M35_012747 [Rhynocoris fuscipes]|uniref:Uncharacterized protein n=1 Tax=Rhynocoris fuscipes TaxID=488301 RepID=A0AAW1CWK1_9HEMI
MSSFMAAMLVIKLVKMKLIFLLPLIFGVTTAKKILLKVLLFLFPALAHLFKLCAYYHHQHTKYHLHHHHQVTSFLSPSPSSFHLYQQIWVPDHSGIKGSEKADENT